MLSGLKNGKDSRKAISFIASPLFCLMCRFMLFLESTDIALSGTSAYCAFSSCNVSSQVVPMGHPLATLPSSFKATSNYSMVLKCIYSIFFFALMLLYQEFFNLYQRLLPGAINHLSSVCPLSLPYFLPH